MSTELSPGMRVSVCLPICLATLTAFAQSQVSDSQDSTALQRVLQYEVVLGTELSTKVGICVDDAMGNAWLFGEDPSQGIRPSVLSNLRHASETCAVTMSTQKGRLAAQLREMTERQLKLAVKLDQPANASRNCLKTAGATEAVRACIGTAIGKPLTESEWGFWNLLLQRFTFQ
jgi:hypothetical protein